jgi:hypothetical protein
LALVFTASITIFMFVVTQPYVLLDMPNFVGQVTEQSSMVRGTFDVPYVRQFAGTIPYVYQVQNMLVWGMGVTAGLTALAGLLWLITRSVRRRGSASWLIVLSWIIVYGAIAGSFYVKFMRYMLPLYPTLSVVAAAAACTLVGQVRLREQQYGTRFKHLLPFIQTSIVVLVLGGTVFQGLALLNVYSTPNTRVEASRWIYANLPRGSVLTYEQWDDALPVSVDGHDPDQFVQATYIDGSGQAVTGLDLYGDDTLQKAQQLARILPTVNAITMPTDRLDKSIPRLPQRYPLTIHYYQLLYNGQLGFHLAAQFTNHPHLLGVTLDDSNADESYSVFDHPTARIFVRDTPYPYTSAQLVQKLLAGVHLPDPTA